MDQIAFSRNQQQAKNERTTLTILALLDAIRQDERIAPKRRADIVSGVRSLCRALHLQPESTLADPRPFAELLTKATPASVQMSKGRFQNCRSHLDTALAFADAHFHRKRSGRQLEPGFETLLATTPDRWERAKLRAFFRFAAENGVGPDEIVSETFDAYAEALQNSTATNARARGREIRKIWNKLSASDPTLPDVSVPVPSFVDHYVLPTDVFPQSLWVDLDAYLAFRSKKSSLDLDDLLTEDELFGEDEQRSVLRLRDSTASLIRYRVRQFASVLVIEGAKSADQLNNHRLKPVGWGLRTESPDTRRLNDASTPAPS